MKLYINNRLPFVGEGGIVDDEYSSLGWDKEGFGMESGWVGVDLRDLGVLDLLNSIEVYFDSFAYGVDFVAVVHKESI